MPTHTTETLENFHFLKQREDNHFQRISIFPSILMLNSGNLGHLHRCWEGNDTKEAQVLCSHSSTFDHEFQAPLPRMFSSYPYHPILSSFSLFLHQLPLYVLRSKVMAMKSCLTGMKVWKYTTKWMIIMDRKNFPYRKEKGDGQKGTSEVRNSTLLSPCRPTCGAYSRRVGVGQHKYLRALEVSK